MSITKQSIFKVYFIRLLINPKGLSLRWHVFILSIILLTVFINLSFKSMTYGLTDSYIQGLEANYCASFTGGSRNANAMSGYMRVSVSGNTATFTPAARVYRCPNAIYTANSTVRITGLSNVNASCNRTLSLTLINNVAVAPGALAANSGSAFTCIIDSCVTPTYSYYYQTQWDSGNWSFSENVGVCPQPDQCNNLTGFQSTVPIGYTRINGNCYRAPTVTLTVSCSGGIVTVNYSASDADGDFSYVNITPGGVTPAGTRTYYSSSGPYNYTFNGTYGTTYTVTARAYDTVGLSSSNTSRTYSCTAPPPSATCSFTIPDDLEYGSKFIPTMSISRNTDASSPDVSVTFSATSNITGTSSALTGASPTSPVLMRISTNPTQDVTFSELTINSTSSTATFTGSISWTGGSFTCPAKTVNLIRKPIFNVTNGDLLVGGKYPSGNPASCENTANPTDANAYSWATGDTAFTVASRKGANTEHVAKILGTALEIYSAGTGYSTIPTNLTKKWLTISNTAGEWGGSSSTTATCMTDIFTATKKNSADIYTIPLSSLSYTPSSPPIKGDQAQYTGDLILNGATDLKGKRAIYVEGNVYIADSIKMNTIYTNGVIDIPFFALIVKGNIYVAPGVTQLDGMYVAQPTLDSSGNHLPNTGTIFTCASGTFTSYSTTDLTNRPSTYFTNCGNPLTFNGIVQAKKLRLHRVNGTMSTNTPAETFNNLPELYLTSTPFRDTTSDSAQYDSAATLPPLL